MPGFPLDLLERRSHVMPHGPHSARVWHVPFRRQQSPPSRCRATSFSEGRAAAPRACRCGQAPYRRGDQKCSHRQRTFRRWQEFVSAWRQEYTQLRAGQYTQLPECTHLREALQRPHAKRMVRTPMDRSQGRWTQRARHLPSGQSWPQLSRSDQEKRNQPGIRKPRRPT